MADGSTWVPQVVGRWAKLGMRPLQLYMYLPCTSAVWVGSFHRTAGHWRQLHCVVVGHTALHSTFPPASTRRRRCSAN